jgi:hypothetical protein
LGAVGLDGALYTKKGLTPSIAMLPLVALADALPWLTTRATVMLFNPLVTALTGALLYTFTRKLGYAARTAFTVGLIYGAATFALPYIKTLFGEPLAGLLLLTAVMALHADGRPRDLFVAGIMLGLLVGVNTIYGLFLPVFAIYVWMWRSADNAGIVPTDDARSAWRSPDTQKHVPTDDAHFVGMRPASSAWRSPDTQKHVPTRRALSVGTTYMSSIRTTIVPFAAPIVIILVLIALYNTLRFGSPFDSGYHFADGEGFTRPIPLGIYGLLISPYRGLFWYNPVLLLALPGWLMLRRAMPRLAWLLLALTLIQLIAFAGWWSWHGGIVWGPRFLIPATPLIALMLAPLIERTVVSGSKPESERKKPPEGDSQNIRLGDVIPAPDRNGEGVRGRGQLLRIIVIAFVALSLFAQLLGTLYSHYTYQFHLNVFYGTDIWNAPVTLLRDEVLYHPGLSPIIGHLALLRLGWQLEPAWIANGVDRLHLLAALALIAAGFTLLFLRRFNRWILAGTLTLIVVSLNIVAARAPDSAEIERVHAFETGLQPAGTVVVASTDFDSTLVDVERGGRIISMVAPTDENDELARDLWRFALNQEGNLWLVTWFGAADAANWQARELWQNHAFVTERTVADHRALWFDLSPMPTPDTSGGWIFGDRLALDSYGVATAPDGVRVTLQWSAIEPLDANYSWFAHLLDSDDNIIAQQDRPPQGGYAPTAFWTPGDPIIDRLYFPLEAGAAASLRIGWIDPTSGARLPVTAADGSILPDNDFIRLPIE